MAARLTQADLRALGGVTHDDLRELGIHAGLCDDRSCTPCLNAKAAYGSALSDAVTRATQARLFRELKDAALWQGIPDAADAITHAYGEWVAVGRPEPDADHDDQDSDEFHVLNIDGLKIVG